MKSFTINLLFAGLCLMMFGCDSTAINEIEGPEAPGSASGVVTFQTAELFVFQPAGPEGGGVLIPGTEFPATDGSESTLKRMADKIHYSIKTTGLPEGAYTNWIVTINEPENCLTSPCTDVDVFGRTEEVDASVFWAAGNTVGKNGKGNFSATIWVGELPDGDDQIGWPIDSPVSGLLDPFGAEIHFIVKYHGLTSQNPEIRYDQLNTLTGSCEEGANAYDYGAPFFIQCFDPQAAIHQAP